jgi:MoaA/NifB/PqqE/SkfB family radical SAM enzyme
VVSPEGGVSPCVYTNVPAQSGHYFLRGKAQPLPSLCFGTLPDHSFLEIWQQPAYRSFRQSRQRGRLTGFCRHCLKMPTD